MKKEGQYHMIGKDGKPAGVAISLFGERDGYGKRPGYMATRNFDLVAGRTEMLALKAEGYILTRGGDVDK